MQKRKKVACQIVFCEKK